MSGEGGFVNELGRDWGGMAKSWDVECWQRVGGGNYHSEFRFHGQVLFPLVYTHHINPAVVVLDEAWKRRYYEAIGEGGAVVPSEMLGDMVPREVLGRARYLVTFRHCSSQCLRLRTDTEYDEELVVETDSAVLDGIGDVNVVDVVDGGEDFSQPRTAAPLRRSGENAARRSCSSVQLLDADFRPLAQGPLALGPLLGAGGAALQPHPAADVRPWLSGNNNLAEEKIFLTHMCYYGLWVDVSGKERRCAWSGSFHTEWMSLRMGRRSQLLGILSGALDNTALGGETNATTYKNLGVFAPSRSTSSGEEDEGRVNFFDLGKVHAEGDRKFVGVWEGVDVLPHADEFPTRLAPRRRLNTAAEPPPPLHSLLTVESSPGFLRGLHAKIHGSGHPVPLQNNNFLLVGHERMFYGEKEPGPMNEEPSSSHRAGRSTDEDLLHKPSKKNLRPHSGHGYLHYLFEVEGKPPWRILRASPPFTLPAVDVLDITSIHEESSDSSGEEQHLLFPPETVQVVYSAWRESVSVSPGEGEGAGALFSPDSGGESSAGAELSGLRGRKFHGGEKVPRGVSGEKVPWGADKRVDTFFLSYGVNDCQAAVAAVPMAAVERFLQEAPD